MIREIRNITVSPDTVEHPVTQDAENSHSFDENAARLPDDSGERRYQLELPDDSGERRHRLELPDDSGERRYRLELPDDSGERRYRLELPDDSGERMPQKKADNTLETACTGGSYKDVKNQVDASEKKDVEVHHIPADSASHLDRSEGPAIEMEKADHRRTASCGNSREAIEYRNKQRDLIEKGDFQGAVQMDIDDIRMKFGSKYDEQIKQMLSYVDKLKEEGKI